MRLTTNKDLNKVLRRAKKEGATVERDGGHVQVRFNGQMVTIASSPSDRRAVANINTYLKRIGL